jgi:hypothetical protein
LWRTATTIVAIVTSTTTTIPGRRWTISTAAIPTTRDKSASDVDVYHPLERVEELGSSFFTHSTFGGGTVVVGRSTRRQDNAGHRRQQAKNFVFDVHDNQTILYHSLVKKSSNTPSQNPYKINLKFLAPQLL